MGDWQPNELLRGLLWLQGLSQALQAFWFIYRGSNRTVRATYWRTASCPSLSSSR